MLRSLVAALLLLGITQASLAQTTVGDAIPPAEVDKAQATLKQAAPKVIKLEVGEFEQLPQATMSPTLWFPLPGSDETAVSILSCKAGQTVAYYGKKRGDKEAKLHNLTSATPWLLAIGAKPGIKSSVLFKNNDNKELPPVQTDQVQIVVGDPPPIVPPDVKPPVLTDFEKQLAAAYAQDRVAGIASPVYAGTLAQVFANSARDGFEDFKTLGELDAFLEEAALNGGVPPPDKSLTNTRIRIQAEIQKALGITDADRTKPMTAATKTALKDVFTRVAAALKNVAK
jgi:hypothetical protein